MAHTPEQRSRQQLCLAKKKNGTLCRAFAGQGTDHPGHGRCKYHLGNSPSHNKKAAVAQAKARVIEWGNVVDITPAEALLMAVRISAGQVAFIKSALEREDSAGFDRQVLLSQWDSERDRLIKSA